MQSVIKLTGSMIFKSKFAIIIALFLLPDIALPQYTVNDRDLVYTTFTRTFNNQIILNYLNSQKKEEVNAALLSIGNSLDTNFVDDVIKVNFNEHYEFICFALGKIGKSKISSKYLFDKLFDKSIPVQSTPSIYEALGKCGDGITFLSITDSFKDRSLPSLFGLPSYIFQASINGNFSPDSYSICLSILENENETTENKFYASLALSRLKVEPSILPQLAQIIENRLNLTGSSDLFDATSQFLISVFRRDKSFPGNLDLFNFYSKSEYMPLRVELLRTISFKKNIESAESERYFSFIFSENQNLAIEAAFNLRNFKSEKMDKNLFSENMTATLNNRKISKEIKGTLLSSYFHLNPAEALELYNKFVSNLPAIYQLEIISANPKQFDEPLELAINLYNQAPKNEKSSLLSYLFTIQRENSQDSLMFAEFMLNNLIHGDFSVAENITSKIEPADFTDLKEELLETLILIANIGLNNPDYLEVHQNIYKLAEKFYPEILPALVEIYSSSVVLSAKRLAIKEVHNFDDAQFNLFWNNAFRYQGVVVTTENHSFQLDFTPGYAPISTGSFAYLSLTGGYNGTFFHRVVPGFVIQDGDPSGTGSGGPGYTIVSEFSPLQYLPYTLGMASAGRDTEGSQWFVTQGYYPHLNTNYTVFGKVVAGFDDVQSIPVKEKIVSIKLIRADN